MKFKKNMLKTINILIDKCIMTKKKTIKWQNIRFINRKNNLKKRYLKLIKYYIYG